MLALTNQDLMIVLAAGVTAFVWFLMRLQTRAKRPRAEKPAAAASPGPRPAEVTAMAQELNNLLVELQETARRIAAQIDNRYQKLDAVIAEAEEKIRRLEQLKAEIEAIGAGKASARADVTPLPKAADSRIEDPQHRAVYALADAGKTPREIAAEVGKQPGEVELILALRGG